MKKATSADVVALRAYLYKCAIAAFRMQPSDAEDAVQDAMILGITNLDKFDPSKGVLRAWMHTIMVNKVRSGVRRSARMLTGNDEFIEAQVDDTPNAEHVLAYNQSMAIVQDEMRDPVSAALINGLLADKIYSEMADDLQVPIGTIRSRISRMRNRMEKRL